jgi:hypothetical protein
VSYTCFAEHQSGSLAFEFAFHHVAKIEVGKLEAHSDFAIRRLTLIDKRGVRVEITCYNSHRRDSEGVEIALEVELTT